MIINSNNTNAYSINIAKEIVHGTSFRVFRSAVFLVLHAFLPILIERSRTAATLHASIVLFIGLFVIFFGRSKIQTGYIIAYIAGAEVFWRMTRAEVFWEYGKYTIILLSTLSMVRFKVFGGPILPLAYFVSLLPATLLTIAQLSPDIARDQISFNMSGPFTLFVSAWFFSNTNLSRDQVGKLFVFFLAPIISISATCFLYLQNFTALEFTTASNFAASGGFGPNQVSAILGLGALLTFLFTLISTLGSSKFAMLIFGMILATQSALTFSRGGLYAAGGAIIVAVLASTRKPGAFLRLSVIMALTTLLAVYLIIPWINVYTNGAFIERFQDTNATLREDYIRADFQLWQSSPFVGVGVGNSIFYRAQIYYGGGSTSDAIVASHTEFSRLISEHGSFGIIALLILMSMCAKNILREHNSSVRIILFSTVSWSFLFMLNSGMRIAAPSVFVGLCFANFFFTMEKNEEQEL